MQFHFKKTFGQNFLKNKNIINKIVNAIPERYQDIYEIGPGAGALTQKLITKFANIRAIEIDKECVELLQEKFCEATNLEIINKDVLQYQFDHNCVVIGNLPYNIGTKIIENFIYNPIQFGVFMLQKEVAQRMVGNDYCRLSIFVQSRYDVKKVLDVAREDFTPMPKVQSQVITLIPHGKFSDVDLKKLKDITAIIFSSRRKKLSCLKKGYPHIVKMLENEGIDLNLRPENIPKEALYNICKLNTI